MLSTIVQTPRKRKKQDKRSEGSKKKVNPNTLLPLEIGQNSLILPKLNEFGEKLH